MDIFGGRALFCLLYSIRFSQMTALLDRDPHLAAGKAKHLYLSLDPGGEGNKETI